MKFHENLSSGAELFYAEGRTDRRTDGQTYIMKLIVYFRNFSKELENYFLPHREQNLITLQT